MGRDITGRLSGRVEISTTSSFTIDFDMLFYSVMFSSHPPSRPILTVLLMLVVSYCILYVLCR